MRASLTSWSSSLSGDGDDIMAPFCAATALGGGRLGDALFQAGDPRLQFDKQLRHRVNVASELAARRADVAGQRFESRPIIPQSVSSCRS